MVNKHYTVQTPDDFDSVITSVMQQAEAISGQAALVTLAGDLGAGKTTFTQQLAKHLGVTEPVVSPTFGIMKIYELSDQPHFDQLVHIDAYRIQSEDEVGPLRLDEMFAAPRTLVCVEWPNNIATALPETKISITITITNGEQRQVQID